MGLNLKFSTMSEGDYGNYREEYGINILQRSSMDPDPIIQFRQWFDEALSVIGSSANTMTLATVDSTGQPSARIVLLKHIQQQGLVFYTNYQSRKGMEMKDHPKVGVNFFWEPMERQVRFTGEVEPVSPLKSDEYFRTRPRGSQLGAWASPQSETVPDRNYLETRLEEFKQRFEGREIPRPPHWGGYLLVPATVEFWQGRPNRLHDRLQYYREAGKWKLDRLAP